MASRLAWVDHDPEARERSQRILALFQERETRDELGLGGVRDAFAERLFPGTTTIQTRLRYMLFIPWIYRSLEGRKVPAAEFGVRARKQEMELTRALLAGTDTDGVFGRVAGEALKRLASSVYWAGLGAWGIRCFDASQDEYHRGVEQFYLRRAMGGREDGREAEPDPRSVTWHRRLPPAPRDFPEGVGFALRAEEAQFLRDRLVETHPECLLAHLVLHCEPADVAFPWQHPDWAGFTPDHRELMEHARLFSEVMHGAALLYNLALAEQAGRTELADEHREALGRWGEATDRAAVRGWSLDRLWVLTTAPGVTISQPTRRFVETWVAQVRAKPGSLADGDDARDLIRRRERALKGAHSRFSNQRALDQWSGYSGTGRLVYRWPTAKTFHQDLHAGFRRT